MGGIVVGICKTSRHCIHRHSPRHNDAGCPRVLHLYLHKNYIRAMDKEKLANISLTMARQGNSLVVHYIR